MTIQGTNEAVRYKRLSSQARENADDPSLATFWKDLQKKNLPPPEALKKLGKAADLGTLWAEIQRLETLLSEKKESSDPPKQIPLVPSLTAPPPPPPPMNPKIPGPPPPPGMPGVASPMNQKIKFSKLPMKVLVTINSRH
jgi:hypothetical protein